MFYFPLTFCFDLSIHKMHMLLVLIRIVIIKLLSQLFFRVYTITKTCPCNEHPLTPHFYIGKLGVYQGVHYFLIFALKHTDYFSPCKNGYFQMQKCDIFLIFAQNIDRGYSLEPPHWGGSNVYPRFMFWEKIRKYYIFSPKNYHFYSHEILQYIARTCLRNVSCSWAPRVFIYTKSRLSHLFYLYSQSIKLWIQTQFFF